MLLAPHGKGDQSPGPNHAIQDEWRRSPVQPHACVQHQDTHLRVPASDGNRGPRMAKATVSYRPIAVQRACWRADLAALCNCYILLSGAILLVSVASFDRPVSANDRVVQNHLPEESSHHAACHDTRSNPVSVMPMSAHLHFQRPLQKSHQGSRPLSLHRGIPHSSSLDGLRSDIN